jgi:hypothetical protein
MEEEQEKKIDEEWKETVKKEKQEVKSGEESPYFEASFINFVNGLGLECLVALAKIENPLTKKKEKNLKQAKYIIDTLDIIRNKTKGNLVLQEEKTLNEMITYLKFEYVEASK